MTRNVTSEESHLTYERDKRNRPDTQSNQRQGEFTRAWDDVDYKNGELPSKYSENPGLDVLTWSTLGFRLGAIFGEVNDDLRMGLFNWCKEEWDYKREQDIVEDTK